MKHKDYLFKELAMRHSLRAFSAAVVVGLGVLTFGTGQMAFAEAEARTIHFPSDRSMGTLYTLDWKLIDTSGYSDWKPFCEATGEVTVPASKALRLDLSKDASKDLAPLRALEANDLTMLFCRGTEMTDDQFAHLSHLTGLQEIYLEDTGILGTGLKYLVNLKSLKRLDLSNTHVGDNELAHLVGLPSLKNLSLWGTPTGDAAMVHVGKITSLEALGLSRGVGNEGLAHLKSLVNLRWLSAGNQAITDEGLANLASLTQMESLDLRGTQVSDEGLVHLKQMKKLKRLTLYETRVTEKGLVHLKDLQYLENLELLFGVTDTGLMYLSQLPSLKNVTIDGNSITTKGLALLSKMKSLEQIYVDNTNKMDAIVGQLINLSGLKALTLGTGLTDEGLTQLKNMPSLQELTVGPSQITGKGIASLAQLPLLKALSLHQMKLASADEWASFGKLSSLQRLTLRHIRSQVTDAHIAHLAGLQFLRELSIDAIIIRDRNATYFMDVTDKGIGYISKVKCLERLSLRGIKITDEGLQQLSEIPTLQWVDLQGCKVTEQGLQRLKKKIPALHWYL